MNRGKCSRCRVNEGTVHLLAIKSGRRRSIWLCAACARDFDREEGDADDAGAGAPSLGPLMGEFLSAEPDRGGADIACPGCGLEAKTFRRTNRLGCHQCYAAFRTILLPMLARFHRHVSHVGRVPERESGAASRLGEMTRTRVALEKAIAVENFEKAASLRDHLRRLEQGGPEGTEG